MTCKTVWVGFFIAQSGEKAEFWTKLEPCYKEYFEGQYQLLTTESTVCWKTEF